MADPRINLLGMVKRKAEAYLANAVDVESTTTNLEAGVATEKEGGGVEHSSAKEVEAAPKAVAILNTKAPVDGNGLGETELEPFRSLLMRAGYEVW